MLAVDLRKGTQWLFEKLLIYLFGCVDLSCSLRDLSHVACKLWFVACEILFPDQESNWGPLHWEHRVLSTGPPGKSRSNFWPSFFYSFTFHSSLQTQHQFASISCSSLLHDQTIFWVTQEQSFFSAFLLLSLELLHPLSLPLVMVLAFFSLSPSQTLKSTVSCSLVAQSCPTLRAQGLQHARPSCPSPSPRICSNSWPLMLSTHLILWCPFLLLLSILPSFRVFSKKSALRIRWPKHWSFSISISLSNEYSELIYFRIDWFVLLALTLKSIIF